ncbi:MAG: sigma-54 dependent transcriptional regulator [Chlamydiota bacterium]
MQEILVVEDDPTMRAFLCDFFFLKGMAVASTKQGKEAIALLEKKRFDLVFTDMKMPYSSGQEVLVQCQRHSCLVVAMSAFASVENAVEAMQLGAFHYLAKPFALQEIETIVEKAGQELEAKKCSSTKWVEDTPAMHLSSKNPEMQQLLEEAQAGAKTDANVLIMGESGTGKEVLARFMHAHSLRKDAQCVNVNCPALAESLFESEFFGHEKGAFTGAEKQKRGRFELAHRGTLLLDEVTEIPVHLQAKLLRALQEREFERVGGEVSLQVDVRIIATTNCDLRQAVKERSFREDLFYRLHVLPLLLPPLRDRKEDLPALISYFLAYFAKKMRKTARRLSKNAYCSLLEYSFPGNIRELRNLLERAVALSRQEEISEEELFWKVAAQKEVFSLKEWEKKHILDAVRILGEDPKKISQKLGITVKTLQKKLHTYRTNSVEMDIK